jgi:putative holliday junction resolvase
VIAGGPRAMGLDVGERRIGVAIADELGLIASPLAAVRRGPGDLAEIATLAATQRVSRIVVGLPTGLSGREGPQAAAVREFARDLEETVGAEIAVDFWDERLTTAVAERVLRERGAKREQRKRQVDATAAAVILQGYLDARRAHSMRKGVPEGGEAR